MSVGDEAPAFEWDEANIGHIARHEVTREETEQAILDPQALLVEIELEDDEERTKAVGVTASGRVLAVVFTFREDRIRPITAYAPPPRLRTLYFRRRLT